MRSLRLIRIAAWTAAATIGSVVIGLTVLAPDAPGIATNIVSSGPSAIGGPFTLTSHHGETVSNESLAGKPYLAFFGFTHCPDICPTTLFELTDLARELDEYADRLNVLFITVDPERDTQELLQGYMTSFDRRFLAVRGTQAQTDAVVAAFAAHVQKVPLESGGYTMDHTAGVYMIDAEGGFVGTLDMHEPRETRMRKLRRLTGA